VIAPEPRAGDKPRSLPHADSPLEISRSVTLETGVGAGLIRQSRGWSRPRGWQPEPHM